MATLPPVLPGLRRLLRIEASKEAPVSEWLAQQLEQTGARDAIGRWFVLDVELLAFYAEDSALGAPRLSYVDAPASSVESWRVSRVREEIAGRLPAAFSKDPESEFFVPQDVARARHVGPLLDLAA
ncbi:hypothetical protein [Paraburkholderia youngii]|uniref:hypothetical protein n=1 Tax=Paraburkholderia youngii TaxID=2782701 RepID=UPI003D256B9D